MPRIWQFLLAVVVDGFHRIPLTSRVSLDNYGSVQYVGQVLLGTPGQTIGVYFDTGSSDTWVPVQGCKACGDHVMFDPNKSSTFESKSIPFHEKYSSGSAKGTVVTDTIQIGSYRIHNLSFGAVFEEDETLQTFLADGIVGLGFDHLASITKPGLMTLLTEQNPDVSNIFAFYLTPEPDQIGSELHLGGYDLNLIGADAEWHYTPVVKLPGTDTFTYWTIQMNSFSILGGKNLCDLLCYAIIDSGTSLIGIPSDQFDFVLSLITRGLNCTQTLCENVSEDDFPTLRFGMVPDGVFLLTPRDYLVCRDRKCEIRMQNAGSQSWWILGDVFIKTFYTLFDVSEKRIGFACEGEYVCYGGRGAMKKNKLRMFWWPNAFLYVTSFTSLLLAVYMIYICCWSSTSYYQSAVVNIVSTFPATTTTSYAQAQKTYDTDIVKDRPQP